MQPNMPHLWSMVIRIILPFNQFRSPGISGNFKPFLHTFLGAQEYKKNINITIKRSQGNGPICPRNVSGVPGGQRLLFGNPGNVLLDTQKDSTNPENV